VKKGLKREVRDNFYSKIVNNLKDEVFLEQIRGIGNG